jgi:hypothetical protein
VCVCVFVCLCCRQVLRALELFATYDVKMICYFNTNKIDPGSYLGQVGQPLPSFAHEDPFVARVSRRAWLSHAAWYPTQRGIPLCMVSHLAWYPTWHGYPA